METVNILPQDDENIRKISAQIEGGELTTPEAISKAVDGENFSSDEVRNYARNSIVALFNEGAYKSPVVGVNIEAAINTDKVE